MQNKNTYIKVTLNLERRIKKAVKCQDCFCSLMTTLDQLTVSLSRLPSHSTALGWNSRPLLWEGLVRN